MGGWVECGCLSDFLKGLPQSCKRHRDLEKAKAADEKIQNKNSDRSQKSGTSILIIPVKRIKSRPRLRKITSTIRSFAKIKKVPLIFKKIES